MSPSPPVTDCRVATEGGWEMEFLQGEKRVTPCGAKSIGYMDTPEGRFMIAQMGLSVGECVYGLGERFTPFVKNGQVVEGGRWVREQHGFLSLPLMVRPNTVLPMGDADNRPDYDYADGVTFHVFELADGAEVHTTVPDLQGRPAMVLHTRRGGEQVFFRAEGDTRNWQVVIHHVGGVSEVNGAELETVGNDIRLMPADGIQEVRIRLKTV